MGGLRSVRERILAPTPERQPLHRCRAELIYAGTRCSAGDTYRLEWATGTTQEKEIGSKPPPLYATRNGVRTTGDDPTNGREPSISEEDAAVVAGLAWDLDDAFDMRLDIEWAIRLKRTAGPRMDVRGRFESLSRRPKRGRGADSPAL